MDFFYGFRLVLIQFIYFVVVLLALVLLSSIFIAHILQIISRIDEPIAMSKKIKSCKKTNHQLTNYNFYDAKKKEIPNKRSCELFFSPHRKYWTNAIRHWKIWTVVTKKKTYLLLPMSYLFQAKWFINGWGRMSGISFLVCIQWRENENKTRDKMEIKYLKNVEFLAWYFRYNSNKFSGSQENKLILPLWI